MRRPASTAPVSAADAAPEGPPVDPGPLRRATVLTELGELRAAEMDVAGVLEGAPEHVGALSLYGKIKHMRGELSLAIACGAQLQALQASPGEVARMHLESMLRLAQDPERGAGEFVAVGQFQLVQKPTAYLALEQAFQLYVARRPGEARAVCRQVAERYRKDAEVYKLAVLAEAWICETTGDLTAACQILERLGGERGYETDVDRVLALVSLYERMGTRPRLEAAVNICSFLERSYGADLVVGRLAQLHRRLGHTELAADYEERHLVAFLRAMHRPTLADVLHVAAHDYLPLARLRLLPQRDEEVPAALPVRERAILAAMRDDPAAARVLWSDPVHPLDRKYAAELDDLEHGPERALAGYVEALRGDPDDLHVLSRVLDIERERHASAVGELFQDMAFASRALATLEAAVQANPGDARIWRRLATFFGLRRGGKERQREFEKRAAAVSEAGLARSRAIGRALSAAAYRYMGRTQGLIHEVWASREPAPAGRGGALSRDDILGNLTAEMKDNVRNTFLAVREFALARFPHVTRDLHDYAYAYKVTKEDEPSGGASAGLPTALAFLSVFLQRPVLQDVASTGVVVADSHEVLVLRPVGDIEHKVEAACHRNLRLVLAPAGNRGALEVSGVVPRAIVASQVRFANSLDEALPHAFAAETMV
jgi:hypothetical protein